MTWLARRRNYLFKVIVVLITVVITMFLFDYRLYHHRKDCLQCSYLNESEPKLYFETEEAHRKRLQLQEKIKFGSRIKALSHTVFNEREGYNESFLDSLPIVREDIPDFRPQQCDGISYKKSNTKVSVIINYHNELLSLVLRSLYSVLRSVPQDNIQEVILIDDGSNHDNHFDLLEVEPLTSLLAVKVRFIRFNENKGLIHSRRYGCKIASGDAVLILDSHVEVSPGFIEPLLEIIDSNYKAIAAPIFNFWHTLNKNKVWTNEARILGFDRYLNWININVKKKGIPVFKPYKTPAILGGAFIASKKFLREIDYFGRGMEGWGYENIELTMKYWMCGGEVLYVPCSRVLHYAAERSPMTHGDRKKANHYLHNAGLIIKSYFPEEFYGDFDLHNQVNDDLQNYSDDIEANKNVLKRNRCHRDYRWMRRHLMPNVDSYDNDTTVATNLQSDGHCIGLVQNQNEHALLFFKKCPPAAPECTKLRLTIWEELRIHDRLCLDWGFSRIRFTACHGQGGHQTTLYNPKDMKITNSYGTQCLVQYMKTTLLDKGPCEAKTKSELGEFRTRKFSFETAYRDKF